MQNLKIEILYQDKDLLVIDKPAGIIVYPEEALNEKTLIDFLLKEFPYLKKVGKKPRYGIVHRLDKDTSGLLLVAKSDESLNFFQKRFKERKVRKKYLSLIVGNLKAKEGTIETLIGRSAKDRRKQKVYFPYAPEVKGKKLRKAETGYKVLQRFKDYTLIEAFLKTGRKHQIRAHLVFLGHPVAGDKLYGFKRQPCPKELSRQFLHAHYLKIKLPDGKEKEFKSELPKNLKKILRNLKI